MACLERDGSTCDRCEYASTCRHCPPPVTDPDLKEAYRLWEGMGTQLRYSFGGVEGLDYSALPVVANALGIELDDWMFYIIRRLEADMMEEIRRYQKEKTDNGS